MYKIWGELILLCLQNGEKRLRMSETLMVLMV